MDRGLVDDEGDRNVRADDQAGEEIAEYDRLPQPLEDDGGDRRDAENEREILQEVVGVGQRALPSRCFSGDFRSG